jgi:hypothetical protein
MTLWDSTACYGDSCTFFSSPSPRPLFIQINFMKMIMITSLMQSVHEPNVGQGCCEVQYVSFILPILNLYAFICNLINAVY